MPPPGQNAITRSQLVKVPERKMGGPGAKVNMPKNPAAPKEARTAEEDPVKPGKTEDGKGEKGAEPIVVTPQGGRRRKTRKSKKAIRRRRTTRRR